MSNILEQGAQHLLKSMQASAGLQVQYIRSGVSHMVDAVPGRVVSSVYDERGVSLRNVTRDFVIDRKALLAFDPPWPRRGDRIVQSVGEAQDETFIVTGEDLGTTHYEEADSYGVAWRVHTKRDTHA